MKSIVLLFSLLILVPALPGQTTTLYLVPNTHGTVAGWLVDFDTERNWVLNNYMDHLDRVKSDPNYRFAYSEVPNLISLLQFTPQRLEELKQRIREKRVELTNGFFVEPDVNLSGGEALVQMGALGLGWYEKIFGFRPRHCWMIDLTGCHRQMPQIVTGLGMQDLVFNRNNPTGQSSFWWVAPDGTRALTLNNGTNAAYAEFGGPDSLFTTKVPLNNEQFRKIRDIIEAKRPHSPSKTSLLSLAGAADYSLTPARNEYPSEFLREWSKRYPDVQVRFSILGDYVDALTREMEAGATRLEQYSGDAGYTWEAFWMNMPEVKQYYRKDEHLLQAAEMLAAAASLKARYPYPAQGFYDSWINMLMNMDRNTIWGASAGMVFRDPNHWDAWDRFTSVEKQATGAAHASLRALARGGSALALFNPLNWERNDPIELEPGPGKQPAGGVCEALPGNSARIVCQVELPATGIASLPLKSSPAPAPREEPLSETIETVHYTVRIDPRNGTLASLKLKPSGEELLGGPANVALMETIGQGTGDAEHFMPARPKRKIVGTSSDFPATIRSFSGPLSTTVEITSEFHRGSRLQRRIIFYKSHARIDFHTRLDLGSSDVLVSVDFPLAGNVAERARGIPYGFSARDPRREKIEPILPAIRWSNYQLSGSRGLALLDRGLAGHELNGSTLTLVLINAVSKYMKLPNEMLRGLGVREYSYALVPHADSWQQAGIPRLAYEFNSTPVAVAGAGVRERESFLQTSGNVIVEAMRRLGQQIEVRLYETNGEAGTAEVRLRLPHRKAASTNLMGEKPEILSGRAAYRFPIRPQQIVTLRFDVDSSVAEPAPVRNWASLAPPEKRKGLEMRLTSKGHPGGY